MLAHLFISFLILYLVDASASCTQNADLIVHTETIQVEGFTYEKAVVNKTAPVQTTYEIRANELKVDSVSWLHNGEPIKIDDKPNQEVYYTTETLESSLLVVLHFRMPTPRVTGNWSLILKTADEQEHQAVCFVSSLPILRPRLGAVRGHEGKPLSVVCEVDSYPLPSRIDWQRLEKKNGETRLVPVVNATFKAQNGIENAMMEWSDATEQAGFYLCQAVSPRGKDSVLIEVRIKGMKDILWPAVGILIQLVVLLIIIVIYERGQAKRHRAEEAKAADPKTN